MPKVSVKENKNPYFRKREVLGLTREKAADLLEVISPERIEKIENERIAPNPDDILIMAEKYGAPELCNYYCSNQCPIGERYVHELEVMDLSQIVLKMLASLNAVQKDKDRLIDITADGKISDDEIAEFVAIQDELEKISITVETLRLWAEQMLASGQINIEKYKEYRKIK